MSDVAIPPTVQRSARPWRWIPTLYFVQALPNAAVATLSVVMYKNLGLSNTEIALYTSWLYLPWVIKPLWSPRVDLFGSKRGWTVALQFVVGVVFALVALTLPASNAVQLTLAMFWLLAFASATHDIAADGFYMLALGEKQQAAFVGVRSAFFRLAMLSAQGALVVLAGRLFEAHGNVVAAWQAVFALLAGVFVMAGVWHAWVLPRPKSDHAAVRSRNTVAEFFAVFAAFFSKPDLQVQMGYTLFFVWVCVATLPSFVAAALLKIDPAFGQRQ